MQGDPGNTLPNGTSVKGYTLFLQEQLPGENRYRAMRDLKTYLVRETSNAAAIGWEQSLLQRLQHPTLPEFVETFEQDGKTYLITTFPQGPRLGHKTVHPEHIILGWGQMLHGLLTHLDDHGIHLDLSPENLIQTDGGQLRLIDLRRTTRSVAHPYHKGNPDQRDDLAGLGRCLYFWLSGGSVEFGRPLHSYSPAPSGPACELVEALLQGRFQGDAHSFAQLAQEPAPAPGSGLGRVSLGADTDQYCLAPGTRLAGYEVEFFVRGGMSLCYLGRLGPNTRFIKEVRLDNLEQATALRREFEFLRALKHPNIVRAHQVFEQDGYLYLVMDYIEGASLGALTTRPDRPQLNEETLLLWAEQLCDTLSYLHTQKPPIVYRDLKPANVVLAPKNQLFLIDFGLARTYKAGQENDTQALGTFATASPEHFTGQTDARSDIYSLGATLFLMLNPSYKPSMPFTFPPLRKLNPDFSEGFETLIKKCVAADPKERWQTTAALSAEIQRLLQPFKNAASQTQTELDPQEIQAQLRHLPNLTSHLVGYLRKLSDHAQKQPLPQALQTLASQCEIEVLAALFRNLSNNLAQQPLSSAMKAYPSAFPAHYIQILIQAENRNQIQQGLEQGAAILEQEEEQRRTRSAPIADADPLETDRPLKKGSLKRRLIGAALTSIALGLGGATYWKTRNLGLPSWQPIAYGAGVTCSIALIAITAQAILDTRRLRAQNKAQNLLEDAWTSYALGENEKAEAELGEALITARDKLGVTDLTTLTSLHSLANLCRQRRNWAKAEEYYQQALAIYQEVLPGLHPARGHLHFHRAQNYVGRRDLPNAFKELDQALAIWRQHTETHPLELAEVAFYTGRLHFDQEQDDKALELFSQSMEIQYAQLGLKSPLVHTTMSYLTRLYVRQGRFKESEPHLATLLTEMEQDLEPNYTALAEANLDMGLVRIKEDRAHEAEPYFLRALQLLQHYVGPNERLLKRVFEGYRSIYQDETQGGVVQLVATFLGEREKIRQTLEKHPHWLNARDNTGWGPIQWATFIGRDDIVRWLLERGADPGYDASHAMGPLHVACAWDQGDSLFLLLEKDPDINATGPGGWTPIFWCALTGQLRLMEVLLRRGASVQMRDDQGRSVLHLAASKNQLKMVAALIGAGADVNAQENFLGSTPLHLAAERGHLAICDCLIYNGAKLTVKDKSGKTPLDLAQAHHHKLLARVLRKHLQLGFGKDAKPIAT